jgi:hypothetical protein
MTARTSTSSRSPQIRFARFHSIRDFIVAVQTGAGIAVGMLDDIEAAFRGT